MYDGATMSRREFGPGPQASAAHPLVPILLVALAIFLIVLILTRAPLQGYVVSQRVQASADRAATNTPLGTEQVAAWLRTDAVLASTVQQGCPRDSLAAQNDLIQELGRTLQVVEATNSQNRAGWQLNLPYHDRQLASRLLNKLTQSLTEQLKHLDQAETQLLVQHYQKLLVQIREEEDAARLAWNELAKNNWLSPCKTANVPSLQRHCPSSRPQTARSTPPGRNYSSKSRWPSPNSIN